MRRLVSIVSVAMLAVAGPVTAQVTTIDPNAAIDRDLKKPPAPRQTPPAPAPRNNDAAPQDQSAALAPVPVPPTTGPTYEKDDLLAAADRTFGKGAKGLAGLIEGILKKQGKPNAYIAGREGSGAFVVGVRYGSGVLSHKVAGDQKIYWRGPSIGFDVGGDAAKVFVLVYNLYDTEDVYKRFPGGEGRLYLIGGFSVTYLRRGNIVLIPVRLGVGWRAGVNAGYMKFTHKTDWMPF